MKLDMQPQRVAFIDYETQSEQELTTVSKYVSHPSTRALTCIISVDGKFYEFTDPHSQKAEIAKVCDGRTIVAHNAPFDAAIHEQVLGLPEATWFDTLLSCRAAGLPGGLDKAAKRIGMSEGKDKRGKLLIQMLCILKPGRPRPSQTAVKPLLPLLMAYNRKDVELLEKLYDEVHDYVEPETMEVDCLINQRGIPLDGEFIDVMQSLYERNESEARERFAAITGGVLPSSPKQVTAWLGQQGFRLEQGGKLTVQKAIVKDFLMNPEKFFVGDGDLDAPFALVAEALAERREVVRVGSGKLTRAKEILDADSRGRGQHVYWGAHTGRWSGRTLQVHNFPSAVAAQGHNIHGLLANPCYEDIKAFAANAAKQSGRQVVVSDILGAMLRSIVRSDSNILGADYSAVELRGTAWIADDRRMLRILSDPKQSIYLDMGQKLFGRRLDKGEDYYTFCKALVLGAGYGMSGAKFAHLCKTRGVSAQTLAEAGVSIEHAVKDFRELYPAIPAMWRMCGTAALRCVEHGLEQHAGKCRMYMRGSHFHVELPSGRCIVYRNAKVELQTPIYARLAGQDHKVSTVTYDNVRGFRGWLYGSKLVENVVQGLCRDLLADAMVNAEQMGFKPFLHVHDELNCEADEGRLAEFVCMMSVPPAWAKGFPLLVEAYSMPFWSKQTKGFREAKAMLGRLL